jgi:hypothetical protein
MRGWAAVVFLLAIDFACVRFVNRPEFGIRLYVSDSAAILLPVGFAMLERLTPTFLWIVACFVGFIGVLSLPALSMP